MDARTAPRNLLLENLPNWVRARLFAALKPVDLSVEQRLTYPTGELDRFCFITSGVVLLICTTAEGDSSEIAVVGQEGGVGLGLALAGHPFRSEAVVQARGSALTLSADQFQCEVRQHGELREVLLHFVQALMTQMAQTVLCNRHHSVEQQFCRWILLSLDRLPTNDLWMTQEHIAHLLGVRRAGVAEAAARLQREGLIDCHRGHIRVRSRAALERRACECYRVTREAYDSLGRDLERVRYSRRENQRREDRRREDRRREDRRREDRLVG